MVEKPITSIPMNSDNQTVIIKVNSSKDKVIKACDEEIKIYQKIRNSAVIALDYIQRNWKIPSQRVYQKI
jgi:hypothetical protein